MAALPETKQAASAKTRFSYRDLLEFPDDGKRYEILEGELTVTPSPVFRHQKLVSRLHIVLHNALESKGLGDVCVAPLDVVLDDRTVLEPDLFFVAAGRLVLNEQGHVACAPDLVVEILSPSTRRRDVIVKARLYARFGVARYWLVDPEIDRIECLTLRDGAYVTVNRGDAPEVVRPDGFDAIAIPLAELFAP